MSHLALKDDNSNETLLPSSFSKFLNIPAISHDWVGESEGPGKKKKLGSGFSLLPLAAGMGIR